MNREGLLGKQRSFAAHLREIPMTATSTFPRFNIPHLPGIKHPLSPQHWAGPSTLSCNLIGGRRHGSFLTHEMCLSSIFLFFFSSFFLVSSLVILGTWKSTAVNGEVWKSQGIFRDPPAPRPIRHADPPLLQFFPWIWSPPYCTRTRPLSGGREIVDTYLTKFPSP